MAFYYGFIYGLRYIRKEQYQIVVFSQRFVVKGRMASFKVVSKLIFETFLALFIKHSRSIVKEFFFPITEQAWLDIVLCCKCVEIFLTLKQLNYKSGFKYGIRISHFYGHTNEYSLSYKF